MLIERIWLANKLRNYNYLVACPETGEALAIDPLAAERCLQLAAARGWRITQVVNTHEHADHTGGNQQLVAATGATILLHADSPLAQRAGYRGLRGGDVVQVGKTVALTCLDTPGHTRQHICLLAERPVPALFAGDTLFAAGAGNCHNGGDPELLYMTFAQQLDQLPAATRLYAGHDYLVRNLRFTLDREPDNKVAASLLAAVADHDGPDAPVTTLGQERQINVFFRLHAPGILAGLRKAKLLSASPDAREVFLRLRELRNQW